VSIDEKIAALGIVVPEVAPSVAAYVPVCPKRQSDLRVGAYCQGKRQTLGLTARPQCHDRARNQSRARGRDRFIGDVTPGPPRPEQINRIVKLMVLVNSAPTFTEQHLVANGAS
jgi:hypothetical protein